MQASLWLQKQATHIKAYAIATLRWLLLAGLLGLLCGAVGAAFFHAIAFVTDARAKQGWLLYLLPVGGLLIVLLDRLCRVKDIGADHVLKSATTEQTVPLLLAPAIFVGSAITHLFGGSAGREGAALQLGGSISALLCRLFRLDETTRRVLTVCGMGAVFSAVFGTPIGAFVFALEVVRVGQIRSCLIFPALVSSITACRLANLLGTEAEAFPLASVPAFDFHTVWRVALIAVGGALISILFCFLLHFSQKGAKRLLPNPYLRILAGGVTIVLLTLLVGTTDYNGGGVPVIHRIFTIGTVRYEAFFLKMLFTAITVGVGFKGGEIIPTLFVGATFGGALALLIGLNPAFGAAIGMIALFCGVTNCPLASLFLSIELFGAEGLLFFGMTVGISFLLSGKCSLYRGQAFSFSKQQENANP